MELRRRNTVPGSVRGRGRWAGGCTWFLLAWLALAVAALPVRAQCQVENLNPFNIGPGQLGPLGIPFTVSVPLIKITVPSGSPNTPNAEIIISYDIVPGFLPIPLFYNVQLDTGQGQPTTGYFPSLEDALSAISTACPQFQKPNNSLSAVRPPAPAFQGASASRQPALVPLTSGPSTLAIPLPSFGQGSGYVVKADFNGDGTLDSATVYPTYVDVQLLSSTGSVLQDQQYPVGPGGSFILAGDFNGDGKPDLAVSNNGSGSTTGSVSVLLNNGNGTFQAAQTTAVNGFPFSLALGDFNGDGKLDVAVSDDGNALVWVLPGNGNGTLGTPASYPTGGGNGLSLVAADFNGDGIFDLAMSKLNGVSVLIGNGDGTFKAPILTNTADDISYAAFADLNHDGKMDLAVAYQHLSMISVLLGKGDGTFQTPVNYGATAYTNSFGILPLDDGTFLVVTYDNNSSQLVAAYCPGDGTLNLPQLTAAPSAQAMVAADVNGDQIPDLILAARNSLDVMLVNNSGIQSPVAYPLSGTLGTLNAGSLATGELNGDNMPDFVVASGVNANSSQPTPNTINVLMGQSGGTLAAAQTYPAGNNPIAVVLGHFSGSQFLDAAVADYGIPGTDPGGVSILVGNGDGTFKPPVSYSAGAAQPVLLATADFNGDNKPDLAVATGGQISILLNSGTGTFQQGPVVTVSANAMAVADVNGDNRPDLLVWVDSGSQFETFLNTGSGFSAGPVETVYPSVAGMTTTDLNGDGIPDVLFLRGGGPTDASYLLGNGNGSFQSEQMLVSGGSPTLAAIADFNGDGRPDIAYFDAPLLTNPDNVLIKLNAFPEISVTPASATLSQSQTQQFSAPTYFGLGAGATWTLNPPIGTISASGLYTAPASLAAPATVLVTATSTANSARAATAVVNLAPGSSSACTYTFSPPALVLGPAAATASVAVTASGSGCSWAASAPAGGFESIASGSSGTGNGTVSFSVQANTGSDRSSFPTIAGQLFEIDQAAAGDMVVNTNPPGLEFSVDLGPVQLAPAALDLPAGSHTIEVPTSQTVAGAKYTFVSWSDGGAASHSITLPGPATLTASFQGQYQLTTSASPAAGGTVTPASGGFYGSGSVVNLTATAASGYVFTSWSGPVANPSSASTTVTMSAPESVTANFTASTAITIQTAPAGLQFTLNGGLPQTAPQTLSLSPGSYVLAVASPQAGASGTQYVFASWSDGGAASHSITVGSSPTTYTAAFTTQYLLTTGVSPAGAGTVTANPSSSGYYNAGASVQLTAAANTGYQFSSWSGALTGSTNPQSLTINAPSAVTANFNSLGGSCSIALGATSVNLPATGTSTAETCPNNSGQPSCGVLPETAIAFTVTPGAGCGAWTAASSNPEFLQISSGAGGSGASSVSYTLLTNTHASAQSYSITVSSGAASATYSITEAGNADSEVYRQVYALYEQLLGRDPDSGGFAFWSGTGGAGLGQMADDFLTSPEAFNSDFAVMAAYQAATGAPPTFAQYTAAVAGLRAGTLTVPGLFTSLTPSGYSTANLYQNLLGRAPGSNDSTCIANGLSQCFQTIVGYPASVTPVGAPNNEFQNTGTYRTAPDHTNALYVQMVYYVTLSRDPDPGGFAFWLGVANTGGPGLLFQGAAGYPTRIQILGPGTPNQGFVGSPEFQGLFAN